MLIRKILRQYKCRKAKNNFIKSVTLVGDEQISGPNTYIQLQDGAKKENVIIEEGAWVEGMIVVQDKGQVIMHKHSKIGATTKILCVNRVEIGAYTAIANDTTICDNNNHPISPEYRMKMRTTPVGHDMRMWKHSANAPIIIEENCWIGSNVRICKGVRIGRNSVVAACSVVTKDVPANCIVAGNPAKIVKSDIDKL